MKSIKSYSCIDGFQKTLGMSRFCGIMPLDDQCHLGPMLILASIALYFFQLAFISLWFWLYYIRFLELDINEFLSVFRICSNTLTLILISFKFAQKRYELRAVMWSLAAINKTLLSANLPWNWSIKPIEFLGNSIVIIFSMVINSIFHEHLLVLWIIIFYTDLFVILLGMNQFCTFFNLIEYCLIQIGHCKNPESIPKLYSVIECFWQVLNDIYGPGIACNIVTLYLGVLHLLYNMFSLEHLPWILYISCTALSIIHCMILLQIILTCQKLATQVRKFNMDLYNELKYSRKLLESEVIKFHFETMEEFEFTAYHFFSVDASLIGSMILLGTTYLVTLLQFTPSGIQKSN